MFDNIGGRIKGIAKLVGCVGLIGALIAMIAVWFAPRYPSPGGFVVFLMGLGAGISGIIGTWLCACLTFGFGQLVEDTAAIRRRLDRPERAPEVEAHPGDAWEGKGE